ncbi:MAG: hypothetical protein RPU52_15775 [Candidatus Sedimenticola sp. (ex Thyasira tokunagai)]
MTKRCIDIPLSLTDLAAIESLYGEHETVLAQLTKYSLCATLVSQLGESYDYYYDLVSRHLKPSEENSKVVYQQRRTARPARGRTQRCPVTLCTLLIFIKCLSATMSYHSSKVTGLNILANGVVTTNKLCFINLEGIDLVVHFLAALKFCCIFVWINAGSSQTQIFTVSSLNIAI